jgi:integrase
VGFDIGGKIDQFKALFNKTILEILGKGRYTMLLETALNVLKQYLRQYKPENWLFEGARAGSCMAF